MIETSVRGGNRIHEANSSPFSDLRAIGQMYERSSKFMIDCRFSNRKMKILRRIPMVCGRNLTGILPYSQLRAIIQEVRAIIRI
ncbi:hypothetical protein J2S21_003173 [Peribacillus cavernae]|nr:hypothetical protein [Peribacillus cavernae]